ncbi:MAG: cobalt ECF transporter T component CbiQ [Actinomycetota bacterium]
MSGGHPHGLFVHGHDPIHRLSPHCKIVAAFLFIVVVVSTPSDLYPAFGVYACIVVLLAGVGGLSPRGLLRRLVIEVPFLLFACFLPFLGEGPKVDVAGIALSREGLAAAWNIVSKATLGTATVVVLASTTQISELLRGLDRLRVPRIVTGIAGFMVRYSDVITGEMRRMKIARASRGYDPRWWWQARALASSAGTLFIRSFERGERVHMAMVSRGFSGSLPARQQHPVAVGEWLVALALPALAATVLLGTRLL